MPLCYFTIARVNYVPDGQGGADREDEFFPEKYSTLEAAVEVIRGLSEAHTYIVDDHPRQGMFPRWKGWGGPDGVNVYQNYWDTFSAVPK